MMKKIYRYTICLLFLSSSAVFAGPFTFINDLELGLGFGYNIDYWSLGETKAAPRAIAAGGEGLQRGENSVSVNTLQRRVRTEAVLDVATVVFKNLKGEGKALTVDGVNIDAQIHYHIFPWLFIRTGATVDIPIPVHYSAETNFDIIKQSDQPAVATFSEKAAYSINGLDIEVPVMLGFNLVSLGQFSVYGAIGVNFTFGGYVETLSASSTLNVSGGDAIKAALNTAGLSTRSLTDVKNTYSGFQIGLYWLFGFKYKVVKFVSIYAEMKWLNSASVIRITGTNTVGTPNPSTGDTGNDILLAPILNSANNSVTESNRVRTLGDPATASNVVGSLTRTYNARWVVGATYGFNL